MLEHFDFFGDDLVAWPRRVSFAAKTLEVSEKFVFL